MAGTSLPIGPPDPQTVALQASDLPSGLHACPGSGSIDSYLQQIRSKDPDSYSSVKDAWDEFQRSGADAAAITAYTEQSSACGGVLGAGQGKSAASFVIRYKDQSSAVAAYRKGILGFPNPASAQQTPGLTVGEATGFGPNSWVYNQTIQGRAAYIAFWEEKQFDILVFAADLDPGDATRAARAVDSRAR
ncbi:MAG TPA: hypothetical protein VF134_07545 [Candidatus Dormibacteraeota bacterium]